MESSIVSLRNEGDIAVITMDDGKANALSPAMLADLNSAFDEAEKQSKAVVLTGRPGRFSAGFDLKVMMSGPDNAQAMLMAGGELALRLYEFPLPIVMAVSGHAIAGGVLLAATGDVRIGVKGDFKLGLNEIQNGMPVPILLHEFARDRLTAKEFVPSVLHAKMYSSDEAVEAGWLDRAVEGEQLLETVMSEAVRLSKFTGKAYHLTKQSIRQATITHIRNTMAENLAQLTGSL
ncbi:MAG: crotonase/enoyl-CoA hydratase family protein [Kofleriaceae bacterium]|nr:crotonase/enoyl-CoA hydratase family protein [Kofleriaceae bacterium]